MDYIVHSIKPVYNHKSKILILGTLPSAKSREAGFFYANPQNRFWKVMEILFKTVISGNIDSRAKFLLENNIALWDVISECSISGASDSTIKNVMVNDFTYIFCTARIEAVFLTGKMAYNIYDKYCSEKYEQPYFLLPSTSPANCSSDLNALVNEYRVILKYLKGTSHENNK